MILRREFEQAGGDLRIAIARCLLCARSHFEIRGTADAVEVECAPCTPGAGARALRCPVCNNHLCYLPGTLVTGQVPVAMRCERCLTDVAVRRLGPQVTCVSVKLPQTGRIARQFGIRPIPSPLATLGSGGRRTSCAT